MTSNLREQKRRATLAAIEEHATNLVATRGYSDVTVEDICAAANISRRTFFNYVESKEAAVLGSPATPLTEEQTEKFLATQHPSFLSALLDLSFDHFMGIAAVRDEEGLLLRRRKAIMRAHPDLSAGRMAAFTLVHDSFVRTAATYLERYDSERRLPELSAVDEARMAVGIVHSAMQIGLKRWMDDPSARTSHLRRFCELALAHTLTLAAQCDASDH